MHNAMKHAIQLHNVPPDAHHSINTHVPEGCCSIIWSHTVMLFFLFSRAFVGHFPSDIPDLGPGSYHPTITAVHARRPCLQQIRPAFTVSRAVVLSAPTSDRKRTHLYHRAQNHQQRASQWCHRVAIEEYTPQNPCKYCGFIATSAP